MKRILIFLVVGAFSGGLGCDSAKVESEAQSPTVVEAPIEAAPASGDAPSQPVDVATIQKMMKGKLTVMGEQVFSANCSKCHAFEGNAAPDLVGAGARLDEATFKEVVTKGRGEMPAHPMLTDVQKRALWLFVSSATPGSSTAIAKDREGAGCACGGACGGDGAAAPAAAKGCGGSCGQGAAAAPGEGHGCGQGAGAAPGEGHGCGQGAGAAPGEGCGAGCGQNANE